MTVDDEQPIVFTVGPGFQNWLATFYKCSGLRDPDGPGPDTLARWFLAEVDPVDAYLRLRVWPRFFGYDPPPPPAPEVPVPPDVPAWQFT